MASDPDLPNVFELVHLRAADDARAEVVRRAHGGAPEGTFVWVDAPRMPRARLDRAWRDGDHAGLHAALLLRPGLPADDCAQLGPVTTVAIGRAIADVVIPMTELHYRWPNDVLLDGGKVAGVWLEGGGTAQRLDWLAIAFAINTGEVPADLGFEAPGLDADGAAGDVDPGDLLRAVARHLLAAIEAWDEEGFAHTARTWRRRLITHDSIRIVLPEGPEITGTIETVEEDGTLALRGADGMQRVTLARFFGLGDTA